MKQLTWIGPWTEIEPSADVVVALTPDGRDYELKSGMPAWIDYRNRRYISLTGLKPLGNSLDWARQITVERDEP